MRIFLPFSIEGSSMKILSISRSSEVDLDDREVWWSSSYLIVIWFGGSSNRQCGSQSVRVSHKKDVSTSKIHTNVRNRKSNILDHLQWGSNPPPPVQWGSNPRPPVGIEPATSSPVGIEPATSSPVGIDHVQRGSNPRPPVRWGSTTSSGDRTLPLPS